MESRTKAMGHAVHPMLIVFPLGLLSTAVIFDVLHLVTDRPSFAATAGHLIAAGVLGGVLASVFGLVDWLATPRGSRARRIGAVHGLGNIVVMALFAVSWLLRVGAGGWEPSGWAVALGFVGFALSGLTAWMGGELVERLGVGVDEGAHVDAPSSLSRREVPGTPRTA